VGEVDVEGEAGVEVLLAAEAPVDGVVGVATGPFLDGDEGRGVLLIGRKRGRERGGLGNDPMIQQRRRTVEQGLRVVVVVVDCVRGEVKREGRN